MDHKTLLTVTLLCIVFIGDVGGQSPATAPINSPSTSLHKPKSLAPAIAPALEITPTAAPVEAPIEAPAHVPVTSPPSPTRLHLKFLLLLRLLHRRLMLLRWMDHQPTSRLQLRANIRRRRRSIRPLQLPNQLRSF